MRFKLPLQTVDGFYIIQVRRARSKNKTALEVEIRDAINRLRGALLVSMKPIEMPAAPGNDPNLEDQWRDTEGAAS